jgi:hypothetical protein
MKNEKHLSYLHFNPSPMAFQSNVDHFLIYGIFLLPVLAEQVTAGQAMIFLGFCLRDDFSSLISLLLLKNNFA